MTLLQLSTLFNRALARVFGTKKFFCLFFTLILSGIVILFFQLLALYAADWLQLALEGIALFLTVGFLLASGMLLIRIYAHERVGSSGGVNVKEELVGSWEVLLRASYCALPLLLVFLVIWVVLGIFIALKTIPYIGSVLGIVLAFAPFLLHLATLVLFALAVVILFFLTPRLALNEKIAWKPLLVSLKENVFIHLLLLCVGLVPAVIVWLFLSKAAHLTFGLFVENRPFEGVLQAFFILIPFTAILTPAIIFFFNFALEAHLEDK